MILRLKQIAGMIWGVVLATSLTAASSPDPSIRFDIVGYIIGAVPVGGTIELFRDNKSIPVVGKIPMVAGDQLLISGRATVRVYSNRTLYARDYSSEDSPVQLGQADPPSGTLRTVITLLWNKVFGQQSILGRPPAKQNSAPSKGVGVCETTSITVKPLARSPILASIDQDVWQRGPYFIAWNGGRPPYRLTQLDGSPMGRSLGDELCDTGGRFEITEPVTGMPTVVTVSDDAGNTINWTFRRIDAPSYKLTIPAETPVGWFELAIGLNALDDPKQRRGVMGLTILDRASKDNFMAWRVVRAAFDGEAILQKNDFLHNR